MDIDRFVSVVKSFADKPINVDYDSGKLLAEVQNDIFEVEFEDRHGALWCVENDTEYPAGKWIIKRLGRFDLLARRILDHIPEDPLFIPVQGEVMDVLENDPDEGGEHTDNALDSVRGLMGSRLAGMTKVVYLTSDAGEGKTSLIDQLSRRQAERYLSGDADWLMLPVKLGGRPFIRLDDVIVGTLSNRLRFLYYYFDSVIELVKLNALVLALDGFEEMFIETRAGDAVSSLGNLVTQLDSKGRLLVAARSAYYRYRDFEAHAKLFQSIREADVSFAEVSLEPWSREQFTDLADRAGIGDQGGLLFDQIAKRLGSHHPLLTRAVLARKLIEEFHKTEDKKELINQLSQASGEEYFDNFVSRLITREATEKWIDRSALGDDADAARPLLSTEEHHSILSAIAEEMWRNGVDALNVDYLEEITEIVVELDFERRPEVVDQAKDRITQHALLVNVEGTNQYRFDHEHFQSYYLGRYLAQLIEERRLPELRSALEVKTLPDMAIRVCVTRLDDHIDSDNGEIPSAVDQLCEIAKAGRRTSFLRANAGGLALAIMDGKEPNGCTNIQYVYISSETFRNHSIQNVCFYKTVFERMELDSDKHKEIDFEDCTVVHAVARESGASYSNITMDDKSIPPKLTLTASKNERSRGEDEQHYYEPDAVKRELSRLGIEVPGLDGDEPVEKEVVEPDLKVKIVDRVLRYYQRSTSINENVFKKRLGDWWTPFEDDVLPDLVRLGVLNEVPYAGGGQQKRFRLSIGFEELEEARKSCDGDYEKLIKAIMNK